MSKFLRLFILPITFIVSVVLFLADRFERAHWKQYQKMVIHTPAGERGYEYDEKGCHTL